jgi:predicted O-methyltransferase YrrM
VTVEATPVMTDAEIGELVRLAKGKRVIEVGSLYGGSTVALARAADHVVSIDHHRGDAWTGPLPTLAQFLEVLEDSGVREKVTAVLDDWRHALPLVDPLWPGLVFLDAEHDDVSVYDQLVMASRFECGVIAVHDFGKWTVKAGVERYCAQMPVDTHLVDELIVLTL